jgi:hypothetical protein
LSETKTHAAYDEYLHIVRYAFFDNCANTAIREGMYGRIVNITYMKKKIIYIYTGKVDPLLPKGHQLLSHLGHLRAKIGPGTF